MKWSLFSKKIEGGDLLQQADSTIDSFAKQKQQLEAEKDNQLHRQVELWSIMNLSPEMEEEYHQVGVNIAYLVKCLLAIDERVKQLNLARFHCKEGECGALQKTIELPNPTECVNEDPKQILYSSMKS